VLHGFLVENENVGEGGENKVDKQSEEPVVNSGQYSCYLAGACLLKGKLNNIVPDHEKHGYGLTIDVLSVPCASIRSRRRGEGYKCCRRLVLPC